MKILLEEIIRAVRESIPYHTVGVAFSGGVDSTLMARICMDLGYDTTLLTVGFCGSQDISFAEEIGDMLGVPHETLEIEPSTFGVAIKHVGDVLGEASLSWHENAIAFYYVAKLACGLGIRTVVTANGIDELFCGYDVYRREFYNGKRWLQSKIESMVRNEIDMTRAIDAVVSGSGVRIIQPLLLPGFISYARSIPLEEKIHGQDDLLRKHPIRRLAREIGVPEISAGRRKKALQYGSRIHAELLKYKKSA